MPEHSSPRLHVLGRRRTPLLARVLASLLVAPVLSSCTSHDGADGRRTLPADGAAAASGAAAPSAVSSGPGQATGPAAAMADSAASLDARFQALRAAINRDARALDASPADRRSADYAARYDDLRRRTMAAESLRVQRDVLRGRLAKLGGAAAPVMPNAGAAARADAPRRG